MAVESIWDYDLRLQFGLHLWITCLQLCTRWMTLAYELGIALALPPAMLVPKTTPPPFESVQESGHAYFWIPLHRDPKPRALSDRLITSLFTVSAPG